MALIVQKYGGSSVATPNHILSVARCIKQLTDAGHQVVVVVSAMGNTTDNLLDLASQVNTTPDNRELDVLLSSGEQIAVAILTLALQSLNCAAQSLLGHQLPIVTNTAYGHAEIHRVHTERIVQFLQQNIIPVIAGFQGVTSDLQNITTIGRGGSDTTAVLLAAALNADECNILTDVDGIYMADPNLVPYAKKFDLLSYQALELLANNGAQVLQGYAAQMAARHQVKLKIAAASQNTPGTLIINHAPVTHPELLGITVQYNCISVIWHTKHNDLLVRIKAILFQYRRYVCQCQLREAKVSVIVDDKYVKFFVNLLASKLGLSAEHRIVNLAADGSI